MRRHPSPLIAVLCALFLLEAQQAAFVHWIGHIGISVGAASAPHGEDSGDGDAPSHTCTSCATFAALTAAPPAVNAPIPVPDPAAKSFALIPSAHLPAPQAPPYASRAPPAIL